MSPSGPSKLRRTRCCCFSNELDNRNAVLSAVSAVPIAPGPDDGDGDGLLATEEVPGYAESALSEVCFCGDDEIRVID